MPKQYSGLGRDTGGANHPGVSDIDQFGKNLNRKEVSEWLQDNVGVSKDVADKAADVLQAYSLTSYKEIHYGADTESNKVIDDIIHNPNAPVFTGKQYRGVYVDADSAAKYGNGMTPREYVENILKTGVWKEPGASSFSSSIETARSFGNFEMPKTGNQANDISVMIHYYDGKSGMPFKHISECSWENEVLHSGRQMSAGMPILRHEWTNNDTEVHIYVTDKKGTGKRRK